MVILKRILADFIHMRIVVDWLFGVNWFDFFAVYYVIGLIISFFVVVVLGFLLLSSMLSR